MALATPESTVLAQEPDAVTTNLYAGTYHRPSAPARGTRCGALSGLSHPTSWIPLIAALLFFPATDTYAEQAGRRIDRSLIGSPASPAFGTPSLPEFREEGREDAKPVLPAPPPQPQAPESGRLAGFYIDTIVLEGNQAMPADGLAAIAAEYEHRWVSIIELYELRERLTRHYVDAGFVNSGAVIPSQKIPEGRLVVRLVEGRLTATHVSGNAHISASYLKQRIALDSGPPLNVYRLAERLRLIEDHPLIRSFHSTLRPGSQPGEAELDVEVLENSPHRITLDLSNRRPPSTGEFAVGAEYTHLSLTGNGDQLAVRGELAEGLDNYSLSYSLPLNRHDTLLGISYENNDLVVVDEPFQDLDIKGRNWIAAASISHPVYRKPDRELYLSAGIEVEKSRTSLLGMPFDFTGYSENGEAKVAVVYLGQDWLWRGTDQVLALRSTFKFGIDAFDATRQPEGPDTSFFSWLGQAQWARRLTPTGDELSVRAELQLSDSPLMTMEQYALGGLDNVRGYRANQLVRDNGFFASIEYRKPLFPGALKGQQLQLALFADYGEGWNTDRPTPSPRSIGSVGLGLIWDWQREIHAEIYYGKALRDIDNIGDSLQDDGIHFNFVYRPGAS